MSSLPYLVVSLSFCFISYLCIFTLCLFKFLPLFCFSHFCLFFNTYCRLLPSPPVHFMQNQTEMPLKMEKNKVKELFDIIFIFQIHFFLALDYHLIYYHFLPCLHPLIQIWSLLFMWLMFRFNETALGICLGFKNVVTIWFTSATLMALKVSPLFMHRPGPQQTGEVKSSQGVLLLI